MDLNQAAIFLASSVLIMLGVIAITGGILIINNLLHAYWRELNWKWLKPFSAEEMALRAQSAARTEPGLESAIKK